MISIGAWKHQIRPVVRNFSLLIVLANMSIASPNLEMDSSIDTMDRILSILQDAQVNNTSSIIDTSVNSLMKPKSKAEIGHDIFNYKIIDVLLQMHTQNEVDVFQDSNPARVKDILESYIYIFKSRFLKRKLQPPIGGQSPHSSSEPTKKPAALIFSQIAEQYEELPQQVFLIIGSFIRREARDALRAIPATDTSVRNFDFGKIKLYQPFRKDTPDPFAIRLGLSTDKFPSNVLSAMIDDYGVLQKFSKNTQLLSCLNAKSLQTLMKAQAVAGGLVFKILLERHIASISQEVPDFVETVGLEKLKAIIAYRSAILRRLDWFLPYRHSLRDLDDSVLENEGSILTILADLSDRFFGICFKSDPQYCDQWMRTLIEFCVDNHGNQQLFNSMIKESISFFKEKTVSLSFDAMSTNWKKLAFSRRNDKAGKTQKKPSNPRNRKSNAPEFQLAQELISSARHIT